MRHASLALALCLSITGLTIDRAHAFTPAHIWSERFGNSGGDNFNAVAMDPAGNVIVVGSFGGSLDFGGGPLVSNGGSLDIVIAKFNAAGAHVWSERFGGTSNEQANGVAVDPSGNVYVTGNFSGTADFGSGVGIVGAGGTDIFLAKYNSNGVHQWSKGYGGSGADNGSAVATTASGDVIMTGSYSTLATMGGGVPTVSQGGTDIFIEKYNTSGTFQWGKYLGSVATESGTSVATDANANVYATGDFNMTVDFGGGGGGLTSAGAGDVYLAKYNSSGVHQWSQRFGSTSSDRGNDVAVDALASVVMTGFFTGTVDFGGGGLTSGGGQDMMVARYTAAGAHQWSRRIGGTVNDAGISVAVDGTGHTLVTGNFANTATFTGGSLTSAGSNDVLFARYDAAGSLVWIQRVGSVTSDQPKGIAADASGNAVITGTFTDTVDFGGGPLTSAGNPDDFLAKYSADPREAKITSITDIGNDQGRQATIHFLRSAHDQAGSTRTLLRYEAYRREDAPPAMGVAAPNASAPSRRELLAAGWTEVGTVDAHGETSYSMVVPTIGDSTLSLGQYYSVFYVRASTNDPLVFFDSPADSGYSRDNLAPGVPSSFVYTAGQLSWNQSAAKDFDYFTVYGSNSNSFGAATLVDYSVAPAMNVLASPYVYYFVTATDFSGNEGKPAKVNTASGVGETPKSYVLSVSNYPNPFNPRTTVSYTVPSRGHVTVAVYDLSGAHVATLFDGERNAGAYSIDWDGRTKNGDAVASGLYFARIEHSSGTRTKKMVLLK
jgi:hypothetical protein